MMVEANWYWKSVYDLRHNRVQLNETGIVLSELAGIAMHTEWPLLRQRCQEVIYPRVIELVRDASA